MPGDADAGGFFSSARERRLWTWTAVVTVAIWATLGLQSTLAHILRSHGLLTIGFVTGMLLVFVTALTQGLKVRPGGAEIAVGIGVAAVYFMVIVRMGLAERSHLFEYGVVGAFIHEALWERRTQGRRVPLPWLFAIVITTALGAIDEGIQAFIPSRVFDPQDMLFNLLAATMAVTAVACLGWVRRRKAARRG